jgi:hypothetical protein
MCFFVHIRKVVIGVTLEIALLLLLLRAFYRMRFIAVSVVMLVRYISNLAEVYATRSDSYKNTDPTVQSTSFDRARQDKFNYTVFTRAKPVPAERGKRRYAVNPRYHLRACAEHVQRRRTPRATHAYPRLHLRN